jgi:hypothetical protein
VNRDLPSSDFFNLARRFRPVPIRWLPTTGPAAGDGKARLDHVSIRASTRDTWFGDQSRSPLAVGIRRSVRVCAIAANVVTPAFLSSVRMGARSAARALDRATCAARPVARASLEMTAPRLPPSLTPRDFAAASAALVLLEIKPASSSATDAICCNMKRPVGPSICGRSANRTSTPASKSRDRNATDRVRRSTLATMIGTRCSLAAREVRPTMVLLLCDIQPRACGITYGCEALGVNGEMLFPVGAPRIACCLLHCIVLGGQPFFQDFPIGPSAIACMRRHEQNERRWVLHPLGCSGRRDWK